MFRGILDYSHGFLHSSVTASLLLLSLLAPDGSGYRFKKIPTVEGEQGTGTDEGFGFTAVVGLNEFIVWRGVLRLKRC